MPSFSIREIAAHLHGTVIGRDDLSICGLGSVADAGPDHLTFLTSSHWGEQFLHSRAGAALVSQKHAPALPPDSTQALILVPDAELAMAATLELFSPPPHRPDIGVHPTSLIDPRATLGRDVRIGPYVVVGPGCTIADRSILHPGVILYSECRIGSDCEIHANAVLRERSILGNKVIVHQNVSIGSDGFGYRPSLDRKGLIKIPHIGNVIIEDGVEIGAGTCVDRGKFGPTVIGAGTKIDNLCQIAHNCRIGRSCVIAAQVGLSGSVTLGDGCRIGGNAGVTEQVTIGSGASIAAKSGVMRDVPDGESHAGLPAEEARQALRQVAAIRKLPEILKRLGRQSDGSD